MTIFSFVKSHLSIRDVVAEYTTLKRAGMYWKACCPFHHERTPSFTVSPHKEIYYCFGCHKGGDVVNFIQEAERCTPLEAAHHLAERYNIALPEELLQEKKTQSPQYSKRYAQLLTLVAHWWHKECLQSTEAIAYLQARGLNLKSIRQFELGYFPAAKQAALLSTIRKEGFLLQDLIEAHLIFEKKGELLSPFEERIIFPIKDHLGRICGFGGRVFIPEDARPKYYNSHDHAQFAKGSLLFGLDQAKKAIQEKQAAFLVEGYLDCIAMVQAGYTNTIATLGTACTLEHLKTITRYTQKLSVTYDGDTAGIQAIHRLVPIAWQLALDLFVVPLPATEDPASYLQKVGSLEPLIAQTEDIFLFFLKHLGIDYAHKSLQDRMHLVREFVSAIAQLADPLKKTLLLQQAANTFGIPLTLLHDSLAKEERQYPTQKEQPLPQQELLSLPPLEQAVLAGLIQAQTPISAGDQEILKTCLTAVPPELLEKLLLYNKKEGPFSSIYAILESLVPHEREFLARLMIEGDVHVTPWSTLIHAIMKKQWKAHIHDLKVRLAHAEKISDAEEIAKLTKEFAAAKKYMREKGIL